MSKLWNVLTVTNDLLSRSLPLYQQKPSKDQQQKRRVRRAVQEGRHTFVVGKTGMGKTKLIKEIIKKKRSVQPWLNVYHVDTKKRGDFSEADGLMFTGDAVPPVFTTGGNSVVWQPYDDNKLAYSTFFLNILNAGIPSIVNIDEAINMVFGGLDNIPRGLKILLAQGRLPGIHVFGGTQEVARSPRQMHSQAFHIISFNVINDYDERMMLKMLRLKQRGIESLGLKRFEFYHLRPDVDEKATLYHSYEQFVDKIF